MDHLSAYIGVHHVGFWGFGCKLKLRQSILSVYESSWSSDQTAS